MLRLCLVIGAMKAGTTSLFAHLARHPEIAPCRDKEPSFFCSHYDRGLDWYRPIRYPTPAQRGAQIADAIRFSAMASTSSGPIITACRTGQQSAGATAALRKEGFEKVYLLGGGIAAWEGASLPLTKNNKK